ncbi:MAG: helix-turn-helix transcriptional regulator [Candidatus Aminicenantes bacterium]|jgi:DNA-binding CsgD family transcriptional regulator
MYQEYTLGVLLTLLSSVVGIVGLAILSRIHKNKRLIYLFASVLFLNFIWFSSLIFNYFKPFFPAPTDPDKIYWFEFMILSLIFIIRFGLLMTLLMLFQHFLGNLFPRRIILIVRNSVIILSALWFVSWIEIPLLGSRYIIDQLMVYTDLLIFLTVIAAAVYLRYRALFLPNVEYKRAVIFLSTIIIFPMAVGSIKLVIGSSLGNISFVLERSMIYITLISFNVLTTLWGIKSASLLSKFEAFDMSAESRKIDDLEDKYNITKREMEVINLICLGKTNKEIADELFISVDTVKDHNYKIFQKTGVKNRTQLVKLVNDLK